MEFRSLHQPYSHRTRFKVVRSTKKLVQVPKSTTTSTTNSQRISTQFKIVRKPLISPKPSPIKTKFSIVKSITNKYKLDRRTMANGRVTKRKPRASLSKCLIRIRGVKFQTNSNGKCLQRLSNEFQDQNRKKTNELNVLFFFSFGFRHDESSTGEENRTSNTNTSEVSSMMLK
jgi:hypothetical protein